MFLALLLTLAGFLHPQQYQVDGTLPYTECVAGWESGLTSELLFSESTDLYGIDQKLLDAGGYVKIRNAIDNIGTILPDDRFKAVKNTILTCRYRLICGERYTGDQLSSLEDQWQKIIYYIWIGSGCSGSSDNQFNEIQRVVGLSRERVVHLCTRPCPVRNIETVINNSESCLISAVHNVYELFCYIWAFHSSPPVLLSDSLFFFGCLSQPANNYIKIFLRHKMLSAEPIRSQIRLLRITIYSSSQYLSRISSPASQPEIYLRSIVHD
jgi:hypothetical protein